jgi:HEAT repeat protein
MARRARKVPANERERLMQRKTDRARGGACLLLALLVAGAAFSQERATPNADRAAEKAAREILAKFDKDNPGWKVRMAGLVELAKRGPAVVPVLVEALQNGSPSTREFAAQALVLFAEPGIRPALEQAVGAAEPGVRIYAIQALSMLGPLTATARYEEIRDKDASYWGVRPMMAAALERDDLPKPAELRKVLAAYDLGLMDSARVGKPAPDFTLTDSSGKPKRLSDFRGQTLVLRFILFDF